MSAPVQPFVKHNAAHPALKGAAHARLFELLKRLPASLPSDACRAAMQQAREGCGYLSNGLHSKQSVALCKAARRIMTELPGLCMLVLKVKSALLACSGAAEDVIASLQAVQQVPSASILKVT